MDTPAKNRYRVLFNQGIHENLSCIVIAEDKYAAMEFVKSEYNLNWIDRDSVRAHDLTEEIYFI